MRLFWTRYRAKGCWGGNLRWPKGPTKPSRLLFSIRVGMTWYGDWAIGYRGDAIDFGPLAIHWKGRDDAFLPRQS